MELQINENNTRPTLSGGIEQEKSRSAVLVYSDVKSTQQDVSEDDFVSLRFPIGTLVPDPDIQRDKVTPDENGQNNSPVEVIYNEGNISKFNDEEFRDFYGVFSSLSIQAVQEDNTVMTKVHQNFSGEWNAFFFGMKPQFYSFSGVIADLQDFPYYQEFSLAFERYLSGRSSTEKRLKTKLIYDNKIVTGFLLGFQTFHDAQSEMIKRFTLSALIYKTDWLRINYHRTRNKTFRGQNLLMNKGNFISTAPANVAPTGNIIV